MRWETEIEEAFVVDEALFDNQEAIKRRVDLVDQTAKAALRHVLERLYLSGGAVNIDADRLSLAKVYLSKAEQMVANLLCGWRTRYGAAAFEEGRSLRYRCRRCGFPDVRTLHCDHVRRGDPATPLACLCANCHNIKSREFDWTGK